MAFALRPDPNDREVLQEKNRTNGTLGQRADEAEDPCNNPRYAATVSSITVASSGQLAALARPAVARGAPRSWSPTSCRTPAANAWASPGATRTPASPIRPVSPPTAGTTTGQPLSMASWTANER